VRRQVRAALREQAAALSRPPLTATELLILLAVTAPKFLAEVRLGWLNAAQTPAMEALKTSSVAICAQVRIACRYLAFDS